MHFFQILTVNPNCLKIFQKQGTTDTYLSFCLLSLEVDYDRYLYMYSTHVCIHS